MRKLLIFFVLMMMLAMPIAMAAESGWYPTKINTGAQISTNAGSARNLQALVGIQTIAAAESSDDDQCWTGIPCNNTTGTTRLSLTNLHGTPSFLAQPDVPRTIILTPSGSLTGVVRITGTNIASAAQTENYTLNSGSVVAGTKAFKTVTKIEGYFTSDTARTLKVGTGDLLGLNTKLPYNTVLFCTLNGVREATAPTVTADSTTLGLNTIDTNSAPGGYVTLVYYAIPG